MKINSIYTIFLSLALALCSAVLRADSNPDYLSSIGITGSSLVKNGRAIELSMDLDFSETRIKTQHTVALTPVLVAADGSREACFPPVVLDGKIRNLVYLRAQRLESVEIPPYHDGSEQVIIRRRNGKEQSYDYTASLPYENWMLDGRVEMREVVHGCVNCEKGESEQNLLDSVLPTFNPDYILGKLEPEPEPIKTREESRSAYINFRRDRYEILENYKDNAAELGEVLASIRLVDNNPDLTITGIRIDGYASPEGSIAHNEILSDNRANSLAEYVRRKTGIDGSLISAEGHGEDWEGFKKMLLVENRLPTLPKRGEVIRLLKDSDANHDIIEDRIAALEPKAQIYNALLGILYPELRRNEYRIKYDVRNFDLEEAREVIRTQPKLLSLKEIYMVAGSYEKGSEEYEFAMRTAAECYPHSVAVMNDRALELFRNGDTIGVIDLLSKSGLTETSPMLLNSLGVAYARAGEPLKAAECFRKASDGGLEEAVHNLKQVEGVIDQL